LMFDGALVGNERERSVTDLGPACWSPATLSIA